MKKILFVFLISYFLSTQSVFEKCEGIDSDCPTLKNGHIQRCMEEQTFGNFRCYPVCSDDHYCKSLEFERCANGVCTSSTQDVGLSSPIQDIKVQLDTKSIFQECDEDENNCPPLNGVEQSCVAETAFVGKSHCYPKCSDDKYCKSLGLVGCQQGICTANDPSLYNKINSW